MSETLSLSLTLFRSNENARRGLMSSRPGVSVDSSSQFYFSLATSETKDLGEVSNFIYLATDAEATLTVTYGSVTISPPMVEGCFIFFGALADVTITNPNTDDLTVSAVVG